MTEREKVIKGLECCLANGHNNCPYESTDEGIDKVTCCTTYLMQDALALLKAQEPVKPLDENYWKHTMGRCGHCKAPLPAIEGLRSKFCWMCGRPVKWE